MANFLNGSLIEEINVTTTAAGTTTLLGGQASTIALGKTIQVFTGSSTQIVKLPVATTMSIGQKFEIYNESSGVLTIQFSDGTAFTDAAGISYTTLLPNGSIVIRLQTNSAADGTWCVLSPTANGTVTAISVASANGFAGTSSGGTTPALTLTTTNTTGSVLFASSSALSQNNADFFWDNTNLGLRIGTNLPLRTSAPEAISALLSLTSVPAALASAINAKLLYTSASANTQSSKAGTFTVERSTSGSVTDTGGLQALTAQLNIDVPTGFTYTNTNGNPNAALFIAALSLTSGGSYAANYVGIGVQADGTAVTGNKTGIFVGAVSGGTNNASIADNQAYTGNYFINQSGTNPSVLGGTHSSPNHINGYTTTATAAGTTTLTVGSTYQQFFTGTTTQTVTLPVVSGLVLGQSFVVTNNSTGIVTVQSSGANTVLAQAANTTAVYTCILTTGTTASSWNASVIGAGGAVTPTVTTLTSGSGTFTTPANASYITVELVGGGGGGGGGGATPGTGGLGGTTSFGPLSATGGTAPQVALGSTTAGVGMVTTSSTVLQIAALSGGTGGAGGSTSPGSGVGQIGGSGGNTPFGGAGAGGIQGETGFAAAANTGSGGGGAGVTASFGGVGGAAGGYAKAIITSPASSYTYSVGIGGGGTTGNVVNGGAGGSGVIIVTTYYNNGAIGTATTITGSANSSQILGTTAGGNAPSGFIGEFVSANSAGVAVGSSTAFVTVASISLTAGDWDVEGTLSLVSGATTAGTVFSGGVSLNPTSEDTQASGGVVDSFNTLVASSTYLSPTGKRRINISTTTTIYLVGAVTYTVAGGATWGTNSFIGARRVR